MTRFYGRNEEIRRLTEPNWRGKALLVAVYGRRRVGKTALVEQAYRQDPVWKFEGVEGANKKTQLRLFLLQLGQYTGISEQLQASDWSDAFLHLERAICEHAKKSERKLVVFLDEFQWLCEMKTSVVSEFKFFWDNYFSKHAQCVFVLCGSVSSFIVRKVVQSKALYGRVDVEIDLQPLSLKESRLFFKGTPFERQVLDMYMVLGGVPQYWLELNPELSLIQNLNENAFNSSGYFFKEFDRLFISHFASSEVYQKILKQLAASPLVQKELAAACDAKSGGVFSGKLRDLEMAGFIRKETTIDKGVNSKMFRYCLSDEFLHFYFRYILPFGEQIVSGNITYQKISTQRDFAQWQGYAFERLCRKHADLIADHLRFAGISYKSGSLFRKRLAGVPGFQIDLLFVRGDKVLTVCEAKYTDALVVNSVMDEFEKKCAALRTLYPDYGIQKILLTKRPVKTDAAYFDHLICFEELMLT